MWASFCLEFDALNNFFALLEEHRGKASTFNRTLYHLIVLVKNGFIQVSVLCPVEAEPAHSDVHTASTVIVRRKDLTLYF